MNFRDVPNLLKFEQHARSHSDDEIIMDGYKRIREVITPVAPPAPSLDFGQVTSVDSLRASCEAVEKSIRLIWACAAATDNISPRIWDYLPDYESSIAYFQELDDLELMAVTKLHRIVWEEYNRRHGIETTEEMHHRMYGKRNDEIVRDFFGDELTPAEIFEHGARKEALYRQMLQPGLEAALVPGLRAFLDRHSDIPAAVATNAEPANVSFVLRNAGLRGYFRAVVDGHQVANPKPHPDVYLKAAELLGVAPEHCVVFEDSHTGVQAGIAAGMPVIGVMTTHSDLAGISLLIRDFEDPGLEVWLRERLNCRF